jgi:hypothetical protein
MAEGDGDRLAMAPKLGAPAAGLDALRPRAATALERALGFVEKTGDELARLRAHILVDVEPLARGLDMLESRQRENGSFPRLGGVLAAPVESCLAQGHQEEELVGALEALWIMSDWKSMHVSWLGRLVDFLEAEQNPDGAWGVIRGNDRAAPSRMLMTGLLAGFLGRSSVARPEVYGGAGAYLAECWSVERLQSGGWPLVMAYALYYTNVFDENAEQGLPWCGRELERGLAAGENDAGKIVRLLLHCDAATLPGAEFDPDGLLGVLLEEQGDDGGFEPGVDVPAKRVGSTLDAMLAILRLCRREAQ